MKKGDRIILGIMIIIASLFLISLGILSAIEGAVDRAIAIRLSAGITLLILVYPTFTGKW